jgi:hypothetical protein
MTQYLLAVNGSDADQGAELSMEEMQPIFDAVDRFNEKLKAEGAWVFAGGLAPIESTTTVDGRPEEAIITDGPFAESKEWIGGFWVIEAPDLDAALAWAKEGSKACDGRVEVRPFQDAPA